jgi:hypothetical protein
MSSFEALYGKKCTIIIIWYNLVDAITLGIELLKDMEREVIIIKQNSKVVQDRQKIFVDNKRTHREFKVVDHVYIRVNPKRISLKMGTCAKRAL